MLELAREVTVLARDHGCGRHLDGDLLRHVRAGEHCDGSPLDASRETLTGRGVEALRQTQHGRVAGQRPDDLRERLARHRDDDDIDVRRCGFQRNGLDLS